MHVVGVVGAELEGVGEAAEEEEAERAEERAAALRGGGLVDDARVGGAGGARGAYAPTSGTGGGGGGGDADGGSTEVTSPVAGSMLTMAREPCTCSQNLMSASCVAILARVASSSVRSAWPVVSSA